MELIGWSAAENNAEIIGIILLDDSLYYAQDGNVFDLRN